MENQEEPCLIEEIILDILHRLPHETLQRFCSVSKSWLDMIANPGRPDSCYSVRLKTYQKLPSNTSTLLGFFYPKTEHNSSLYINWVPISVPPESSQSLPNKLHDDDDDDDDDDMELKAIAKQVHDPLPILDESSLSLFNKPDGDDEYMELKASSGGYLLCQIIQGCDSGEGDNWIPYPHYYSLVNPLTQQRVDLPAVHKPVGGGAAIAFKCKCNDSLPVEFTVVLIDHSPQPNYPALEIKVFYSNLNTWREFQVCVEDHFLSFSGSIPGVNLRGQFFWLWDNQNFFLMFDQTQSIPITTWKLPTHRIEPYNYRALCTLNNNLICYGVQYQTKKIIQVFTKRPPIIIVRNQFTVVDDPEWELIYEVQLQELEHECRQTMKVTCSELDGDDDGEGDLVNSMIFKGFHPTNPKIIFVIFQGMLISYECEAKKLVVSTAQDTHLPISTCASEELNRHLIPFERWAWPNSLPRI